MRSHIVHIRLSQELREQIDQAAKANLTSRSSFIREAVAMRLKGQHLVPDPRPEDIMELLRQSGRK